MKARMTNVMEEKKENKIHYDNKVFGAFVDYCDTARVKSHQRFWLSTSPASWHSSVYHLGYLKARPRRGFGHPESERGDVQSRYNLHNADDLLETTKI